MRILALKGIEDCIMNEKKIAQEEKKTREYIPTALSSSTYPQLFLVLSLMKCGVNFIKFFPLCIDLLKDEGAKKSIITPIEELCNTICQLSNLQLFSCWSPLRGSPLKKVPLISSSVSASCGNHPTAAIDGRSTTYWLCSRTRGNWSVELDLSLDSTSTTTSSSATSGINVVAIQIAWRPQQTINSVSHNSAPKKISIWVKKSKNILQNNNLNDSNVESSSNDFVRLFAVDTEYEYDKQNSWTQIYYLNCTDVVAIQIGVYKQSLSNPTNTVKMYSFDVLTEDTESSSLSTLKMMKTIQKSLIPLLNYEILEKLVYDTLLSLIRVSGSLSVGIYLIQYLHTQKSDHKLEKISGISLNNLLNSMYQQEKIIKIETDFIGASDKYLTNAIFDDSARSKEVEIIYSGSMISLAFLKSTTLKVVQYYCMISAIMDTGIWEWELTMLAARDATSSFGVAKRPYKETTGEISTDVSPDVWLVRCGDGEVHYGGKVVRTVSIINPNDVCLLSYDSNLETVTISVNGYEPYLLFENVPKGTSPIVFLSEAEKSIKLGCVRFKPHGATVGSVGTVHTLPTEIEGSSRSSKGDGSALIVDASGSPKGTGIIPIVGTGVGIFPKKTVGIIPIKGIVQTIPQKCSTLILAEIAKLSKAKVDHFIEQQGQEKKRSKIVLDCPYCIEVSSGTLNQLGTLLRDVMTDSTAKNDTSISFNGNIYSNNDDDKSQYGASNVESKKTGCKKEKNESEQQILSILQIIDSQLFCLDHSDVDLATVGFPHTCVIADIGKESGAEEENEIVRERKKEKDKNRGNNDNGIIVFDPELSVPTVQLLSTTLIELKESSTGDVRMAAAKTFARGNYLFLPNIEDKIRFTLKLLKDLLQLKKIDSATFVLLDMLCQRLSRPSEILQLIQLYVRNYYARKIIIEFIKNLFLILQINATFSMITEESSEEKEFFSVFYLQSSGSNFCKNIYSFLGRFQEQLIYDISTIGNSFDSTTRREGDTRALGTLLIAYSKILAECSSVIIEKSNKKTGVLSNSVKSVKIISSSDSEASTGNHEICDKIIEKRKVMAIKSHEKSHEKCHEKCHEKNNGIDTVLWGSQIEMMLRDTVPSMLLLPLLHGIAILSGNDLSHGQGLRKILDIDIIAEILPTIINLLDKFSLFTSTSISCKIAMNTVNASIYRAISEPVVVTGPGGWRTVPGSFETGESSYTVSEDGQLYTSSHCSNTCGVVNIGFDKTMKGAWEFQLAADSVSDECSVFGAARLPVTSRCYSSSPDLWMRRSYNGYLYAQGNTRGAAMEKIHPDDVIRIEFDGAAGTLSFSLNGSDPEIGFTDITGASICQLLLKFIHL